MPQKTLLVKKNLETLTIQLNRPAKKNALNPALLHELNLAFDDAEMDSQCRMIILEGHPELFCSGMDLQEIALASNPQITRDWTNLYMHTLKRFSTTSKIVVANIDGKVFAGGIGLVAASDWVIATPRSQFKLTETLWGLLPAMIAPYLIRKIGYQKTFSMSLTCRTVAAQEAHSLHLVDVLTETPKNAIDDLLRRINRLEESTIKELKTYFQKMWTIDQATETIAIDTINRLLQQPTTQSKIRNFFDNRNSHVTSEAE